MKMTKLQAIAMFLIAFAVACVSANAGTIKVWASNSVITAADLNANFQHIHSLMVGGHGARLVDADVSPTAAIRFEKIAGFTSPKAYGSLSTACDTTVTGACAGLEGSHVTAVESNSTTGTLRVTLDYTPADTNFAVMISGNLAGFCYPVTLATSAPQIILTCRDSASVVVNTARVAFVVYDQ